MAGLLGTGWDDPHSAAIMGLAQGLMGGGFRQGLIGANEGFSNARRAQAEAQQNAVRQRLLDAQYQETLAQAEERRQLVQQRQAEAQRQQAIQQALPGLHRQPGMTGGEATPQTMGGMPMFSQPMGAAPMRSTPGGFDVQGALRLGMTPEQINAHAGLANLGRPRATRQMEVDDGRGGKRIALVDDFGQEVAGFAGYTPPVQVNRGDRVDFVRPAPGVSLGINMSPSERDASSRGWAGLNETRRHNTVSESNAAMTAQAGRIPPGYRMKMDGSMEAIPGGPADIKAGELGAKFRARQDGGIAQADSVLSEVRDAKNLVGWNTAGLGGLTQFVPATEGRNLSAKLQTIKANLGFDRLQQMRDQSPTGGALGAVAVQELAALQATVASLDQLQGSAQLGTALDKIERHYTNWRNTMEQARSGAGGASGGWDIREKR